MNKAYLVGALLALVSFFSNEASAQKRGLVGSLLGAGAAASSAARSGPKTYGPNELRPDALKACLEIAHSLDQKSDRIDGLADRLATEKDAIARERAELEKDRAREMTNPEIDAFNQRVRLHRANVDAFNAGVDLYEHDRAEYNASVEQFKRDCAGKGYYTSDLSAIQHSLSFDPAKYTK